jgi:hypothetical protein
VSRYATERNRHQREREIVNAALEDAARRIDNLRAVNPWLSGEVLALDNAVTVCASIVRSIKRK